MGRHGHGPVRQLVNLQAQLGQKTDRESGWAEKPQGSPQAFKHRSHWETF